MTCAALLARSGHRVVVHEGRGRPGGQAVTEEVGGFGFNRGPHAFYLGGEAASVLAGLGIRPTGARPDTATARMVVDGVAHLAPGGPSSLLRTSLLGLRDKWELASILRRLDRFDPSDVASTTTRDWLDSITDRRRVRGVIECIIRLTTYVHAPEELSADVAVRQLQLGLGEGVLYLDRGWAQLVEELRALAGPRMELRTGEPITELPDAAVVVVAAGGPAVASRLTGHRFEVGPAATVSCLDLGLAHPPAHDVVLGIEPRMYLSSHGIPSGLTPPGGHSVSVVEYLGPRDEPDRARLHSFAEHAGVATADVVARRFLHRMPTVTAIATARAGGLRGRPDVAVPGQPGVYVVGDWVGPHGHLADAVLSSASSAAIAARHRLEARAVVG